MTQLGPNGIQLDQEIVDKGNFDNFEMAEASKNNLRKQEITYLFPIQVATFGPAFEGQDLIGRDRTGSGKTLAYSLPILERFRKQECFQGMRGQKPLLLVIVPTRELAIQVNRVVTGLMHTPQEFRPLCVYGGVDIFRQIQTLRGGCEVVIATPGRLKDLIERGEMNLSSLQTIILDETDQMLDIGFKDDIERIIKQVSEAVEGKVQHLLFSATMPSWVRNIANRFLSKDAELIDLIQGQEVRTSTTVEHLALQCQSYHLFISNISDIVSVYCGQHGTVIIFTETKQEANDVMLKANLKIECQVIFHFLLKFKKFQLFLSLFFGFFILSYQN